MLYVLDKQYDKAITVLNKQLKINKDLADTYYYLGLAFKGQSNFDDAKKQFEKALLKRSETNRFRNINAGFKVYTSDIEKELYPEQKPYRWIGDIEHDATIDDPNFRVCNGDDKVFQYFNLGNGPVYVGEKPTLVNAFKTKFKALPGKDQNGLIRIRFIVNCKGQAGRFRVLQSDLDYNETEFDDRIISQLIKITKDIKDWVVLHRQDEPVDYYHYLIFKIVDGQIIEILP